MITKDKSLGERCSLCNREVPKEMMVLRKVENNRVICLLCLVEIAEIAKSERA